jgi:hypothetical protein
MICGTHLSATQLFILPIVFSLPAPPFLVSTLSFLSSAAGDMLEHQRGGAAPGGRRWARCQCPGSAVADVEEPRAPRPAPAAAVQRSRGHPRTDNGGVGHTPRVLMQGRRKSRRRTPTRIPLYSY